MDFGFVDLQIVVLWPDLSATGPVNDCIEGWFFEVTIGLLLLRTDAIEPAGIIGGLQIIELNRDAGQRVGLQRLPVYQIGGSFHRHDLAHLAAETKAKLVC